MEGLTLRAEDISALTPEVLNRVAQGEAVEITRGGAVVAKVVASVRVLSPEERTRRRKVSEEFHALREEAIRLGAALSLEEIRELRDDHSSP
jgi:antitoxin (DNA-binding transcriptional repressor) of toxin-antitoxin stability system